MPSLNTFVGVLDHDHGSVHHCTDGNSDSAKGHDVGVDALMTHDDQRNQDSHGQRHDSHQRRAQVPEKRCAYQRHYHEFLDQLVTEVLHGTVYQLAAVVDGDKFHPGWQGFLQGFQLGLDVRDGLTSILPAAQDHHTSYGFAEAVQFAYASAGFRTYLHRSDVA
ncbi:hypothetical protein D3C81_598420 [compost metagenome]